MATAAALTLAGIVVCILGALALGAAIDWWVERRRERIERAAAPQRRVIDGGNRHDWREMARRTPTLRLRPRRARRG